MRRYHNKRELSGSGINPTNPKNNNHFYRKIEEISTNGTHKELVKHFLKAWLISVEEPLDTKLHANYPNPFNPETWIPYQLAEDSDVTIRIYDTSGRIVRTLFTGHQTAGYYLSRGEAVYWDGKNESGEQVAKGISQM